MINNPFFSIIIPVYNVEAYLQQCLDSIASQSFKDFEVILVNDGSTDGSLQMCEEYAKTYNNTKLITQKNKGLSAARNRGLELASGKYIWLIDSDDYIEENSLEILYESLIKTPVDVLGFSNYHFIEETQLLKENNLNPETDALTSTELINKNLRFEIAPWIYVYNHAFLKENKILFREDIKIHEDEFYLLKVLTTLKSIKFITNRLYVYRIRTNSLMRSNRLLDKLYAFTELIDYFIKLKSKKFLVDDFWNSKLYCTINFYYGLYFGMNPEHINKSMLDNFKRIKRIKLILVKDDPFGIKLMKLLHNYCFPLYKLKLLKT